MITYKTPVDEYNFLLHDFLKISQQNIQSFSELNKDFTTEIFEMAGKLASDVFLPINRIGDIEGCRLENDTVITPKGFTNAFKKLREDGWTSVDCEKEFGGQGLPTSISILLGEIFSSCNISLTIYQALTHGAYGAILKYGTETQKNLYLPKLVSCEWTGTMNLTEPHCGTDLSLIRTKAEKITNDIFSISGQKIFISAGEHDLTENIIHLVLAKIPGGPKGVKGLSLFIVPKFIPNNDGSLKERNNVKVGSLEKKMGIHANATCVMNYDSATGYLLGEEHKGLQAMFTMMNEARLGVGVQSIALSEIAYQNSVIYAKERIQGKSFSKEGQLSVESKPIINHPDVRRNLLDQKSFIEGGRALSIWVASLLDKSNHLMDDRAYGLASLLTPVIKGYLSDIGFEMTVASQQIFGGHGYIEEWGMSQFVRDSRIAMIYEGTNGIQAIDLVGRKLNSDGGKNIIYLNELVQNFLTEHSELENLNNDFLVPLKESKKNVEEVLNFFMSNGLKNPNSALAGASDFLHLLGNFCIGFMWAKIAAILFKENEIINENTFQEGKILTGQYYMKNILPKTNYLAKKILSGDKIIMSLNTEQF
ncbi:MAG: acyl-CoA dehydrogenase [Pseudomonadota bacterium]|nr:acyl-CoA dehydrogenase [Pseudomonadota bacterium]